MESPFDDRAQELWDLIARDEYLRHDMGEAPVVNRPLQRIAMVLDDRQVDYAWATITGSGLGSEAGTLHVLSGEVLISSPYGREAQNEVNVEPLELKSISLDVRQSQVSDRTPDGVYEATAILTRAHDLPTISIKAQANTNGDSIAALLALARNLTKHFA